MLYVLICATLLAVGSSATQYFGTSNPGLSNDKISSINSELSSKGVSIDYVYSGAAIENNKEFGDFLAAANITSGFAYDKYMGLPFGTDTESLTKRDTTACNTRSKINFRDELNFNVCNAMAGLVGSGGGSAIGVVASGAYCAASDNGLPTKCNILWVFSGGSVGGIANGLLHRYCPPLLADIHDTCKEKGGDAQNDEKFEMIEDLSQTKHANCDGITIPCTTIGPD